MQNMKKCAATIFCLWLLLSTQCIDANGQAGNAVTANQVHNGSESETSFSENYRKVLANSSSALDILNDSSEIIDDSMDGALKFDDFVPQKELTLTLDNGRSELESSFKNVFKVPKSKTKKTLSSRHSSLKNDPVVNDFNSEPLFVVNDGNLTEYDTYFHAFTHLYDHSKWNVNSFSLEISKVCLKDVQMYLNDLSMSRDYAIKISDASGKYRGLFLFENSFWLGSKQYCYEIDSEFDRQIPRLQFFVVKVLINLETADKRKQRIVDVGQCLPKSCTQPDVAAIMSRDPAALVLQQMITVNGSSTKANEVNVLQARSVPGNYDIWRDHKFYIFGLFVLALLSLIILATIYEESLKASGFNLDNGANNKNTVVAANRHDCENNNNNNNDIKISINKGNSDKYEMNCMNNSSSNNISNNDVEYEMNRIQQHELGLASKLLLCFAWGSNSKVILTAKTSSDDSLTCIHGLRFFTLLWTILVHTYLQMFAVGENRFSRNISERTFIYQLVGNATFSVDTFFFISGLLVVLLFLKAERSKRKNLSNEEDMQDNKHSSTNGFWLKSMWKALMFIFYRFLRLTPAYLFIMVLTELSVKVTYNQSVFTPGLMDHINCNRYFYRNLLYVNNFYPLSEMCMMWSWYLANDFQFYVVAIALLLVSTRYFKVSVISTAFLLLSSWLLTIYMSLHYGYTHKVSDPFESFDYLYDKPWQRFGPYAMGMIAGYILHRVKVPPKVPMAINIALWSISLLILFMVIFGVGEGELNTLVTSLYVSLGHTAWGFALIWITLSCCWDLAKPINSLLSFNGFFPLSRLVFCAYLIHPTVMMVTSFQSDGPVQLRHGLIFTAFLGNAAISFVLAFIISVTVEAPVIRLLKVFFKK